MNVVVE